jgi:hypothetical protein
VVSGLGSAAAADAAWQTPVSISAPGAIGPVSLAVNARGDAIAAWARGMQPEVSCGGPRSYVIEAAFRPARSSWQPAVRVATAHQTCGRGAGNVLPVAVALGPRGGAIVGWRDADLIASRELGRAAFRLASGRWQKPTVLYAHARRGLSYSESCWPCAGLKVALDHAGNATAIWNEQGKIEVTSRPAGRAWSKPATIGSAGTPDPKLALDANGDATVVWVDTTGARPDGLLQSAFKPANGSWQRAVTIRHQRRWSGWTPDLAVNARGDAIAVWSESVSVKPGACTTSVQAAFRPGGGLWRHPVTLQRHQGTVTRNPSADCMGQPVGVRVAFGRSGTATAVWSADFKNFRVVQAASRPPGGRWGHPVTVTAPASWIDALLLRANPRGDALAVWGLGNRAWPTSDLVQAGIASPQGTWQSPITLGTGMQPDAALDAHGNAVAIWIHDLIGTYPNGALQLVVQAATFTR